MSVLTRWQVWLRRPEQNLTWVATKIEGNFSIAMAKNASLLLVIPKIAVWVNVYVAIVVNLFFVDSPFGNEFSPLSVRQIIVKTIGYQI